VAKTTLIFLCLRLVLVLAWLLVRCDFIRLLLVLDFVSSASFDVAAGRVVAVVVSLHLGRCCTLVVLLRMMMINEMMMVNMTSVCSVKPSWFRNSNLRLILDLKHIYFKK
jgi:hypothetical protein